MRERFESLEKREQNLVMMLGIMLVIAVIYFFIYQPLSDKLSQAKQGLAREQQLLTWVEKNAAKLVQLRASSGVSRSNNRSSLDQIINSTARRYKLSISRLQPQSDRLQVTLDNASFVQLLQWIQELQLANGITVEIAEFRPQAASGIVKTRLVVSK